MRHVDRRAVSFSALNFKFEALSEIRILRDIGNPSFDHQIGALKFKRQAVLQNRAGTETHPHHTGDEKQRKNPRGTARGQPQNRQEDQSPPQGRQ